MHPRPFSLQCYLFGNECSNDFFSRFRNLPNPFANVTQINHTRSSPGRNNRSAPSFAAPAAAGVARLRTEQSCKNNQFVFFRSQHNTAISLPGKRTLCCFHADKGVGRSSDREESSPPVLHLRFRCELDGVGSGESHQLHHSAVSSVSSWHCSAMHKFFCCGKYKQS